MAYAIGYNQTDNTTGTSYYAQLERSVSFFLMGMIIPVIAMFGLVGNVLNLFVFIRLHLRTLVTIRYSTSSSTKVMGRSSNLGLIALSSSNLAFCFLVLLISVIPKANLKFLAHLYVYTPCLITFFICTSTWLTVVMSGERYFAVYYPIKAKLIISVTKTKIALSTVFVTCLVAILPLFFENSVEAVHINGTVLYKIIQNENLGDVAIRRCLWAVFFDFVPCAALCYFNAFIVYKIILSRKRRTVLFLTKRLDNFNSESSPPSQETSHQFCFDNAVVDDGESLENRLGSKQSPTQRKKSKASRKRTKRNSINLTLTVISILFLILVAPSEILKFFYTIRKQETEDHRHILNIIKFVTNFMQTVNFSVTFLVYFALHSAFRCRNK